uniref:Uncharacterized protein n=1 Tax=Candidatus Kentrum sp. LFY TaxID=2126342 RepID=A0A450WXI2_9GAMM|nr:MAG: hypothetical protein BECKLFY1418C_GA0070996_11026 [Candidatus Kentron sp. LFY]
MGEARRRGSFDERKASAMAKKQRQRTAKPRLPRPKPDPTIAIFRCMAAAIGLSTTNVDWTLEKSNG